MDRVLDSAPRATLKRHSPQATAGALSLLMDELAYGMLIATPKGQVLHANLAARRELARRRHVCVQEGHLQTADAAQVRVLAQGLAKAEGGRRSIIALRTDGARLSIAFLPMPAGRAHQAPCIALIFSRPVVCDAVMLCFFARAHRLTPAEEQVLAFLCQGCSAPEVAVHLEVAVSTVRSHVRSMCAKTRSSGVRELLGQIAVLPPVGASQLQDALH